MRNPVRCAWAGDDPLMIAYHDEEAMSKDLLRRGFTFVGPTICYAFMQAVGMVNDHLTTCFRFRQLGGAA